MHVSGPSVARGEGAKSVQEGQDGVSARNATPAWRRAHAGSGLTSGLILAYVERETGREGLNEMLARAGLSDREQELRDENCWFSFDTKITLWKAAEAVTGDKRVAERVGESALELSVALGLKRALRALGSPGFVYRNVARANSKFNWAHTLTAVGGEGDRVRLEYLDVSGVGYQHYDCDYTIGLLRTVPQLFGLPAARIAHPLCGARGDDHCEFDVRWVGDLQRIKRTSILAGAVAATVAGVGILSDPLLLATGVGLGAVAAGVTGARVTLFMRRRIEALEAQASDHDLEADAQLASLAALSSELRLDEVLDRITASASIAIGGAQFALLIARDGRMLCDRHSNIPAESLRLLERWAEANQQALGNGPIVIDDLATVRSLEALTVDEKLPLGSACAAPLVFRGGLLGVLIALTPGATVFLPDDVRALETYAGHAAIALSNARLVGQLEREAAEDPLTGLANQRGFHLSCAAELSRAARENTSVALVVLDVDHFKRVNDSYGHPLGDQILAAVADALRSTVRGHDTAARIGGEEFALLLPGATVDEARTVADRARAMIATVTLPDGDKLACSAGVAATWGENGSESDLFRAADRALYEAKRQGRGRTVVASAPSTRPDPLVA
jgi:diguanylate cyclase (GGDEF)-like protein